MAMGHIETLMSSKSTPGTNSKWCTNQNLLKISIDSHKPDVIIISESNANINDNLMLNSRRNNFGNYLSFDKVFRGTHNARLTVLINETFEVERKISIENDINPSMVFLMKTSARKSHMLIANYRQWKGTAPSYPYNERKDDHAVPRFKEMIKVWEKSIALGNPTTIMGDINLDRFEPIDPESRADIKNFIPLLMDFQAPNSISLQNHEPTR